MLHSTYRLILVACDRAHTRFFTLQGDQGTLKSEAGAAFIAADVQSLTEIDSATEPVAALHQESVADSVREWKLQSEPYIFVIDRTGTITDKFEGPVSYGEREAALKRVVG